MADYFSPTVLQPDIPITDMTALERLVLTAVFQSEAHGDSLYFYAEAAADDQPTLEMAEVVEALAASEGVDSRTTTFVREALSASPPDAIWLDLDLTDVTSWEHLVQDIVRRSPTLDNVIATIAFTCTKMRPDGFGGMVLLITADQLLGKSTDEMLAALLDQVEHGEIGVAPGFGVHPLLTLAEAEVRTEVVKLIAADQPLAGFAGFGADVVTDADIRTGCAFVVANTDLAEERGAALYLAALKAIQAARQRAKPPA